MLVGDVFLCSGQSNMEVRRGPVRAAARWPCARSANDSIRLLSIAHVAKTQPTTAFSTTPAWQSAGPDSLRRFSAACYFFGREVHEAQKVPVGLVSAAWGGSAIEPWIGEAGLRAVGGFDARLDILRDFATDEEAANQAYGRLWEDWWRQHGAAAGEPWKPEDAGPWTDVPGLRNWKTCGRAGTREPRRHGVVPEVVRPDAAQAAKPASLSLGAIDEVDQTWVNGRVIRNTFGWGTPRTYQLPAGALREGENVVVVNVLSTWDMGGLTGPADAMALTFADGTKVALGDKWRYRVAPLSMGRAPRAPWEPISGLTTLYNGMVAPIGPYGLRAAAWYQGETNADQPGRLREAAGCPDGELALRSSARTCRSSSCSCRTSARCPRSRSRRTGLTFERRSGGPSPPTRTRVSSSRSTSASPVIFTPATSGTSAAACARAARRVVYGERIAPSGPVPLAAQRDGRGDRREVW